MTISPHILSISYNNETHSGNCPVLMWFTDSNIALNGDGEGHIDRGAERHGRHRVEHVHVSLHFQNGIQLVGLIQTNFVHIR